MGVCECANASWDEQAFWLIVETKSNYERFVVDVDLDVPPGCSIFDRRARRTNANIRHVRFLKFVWRLGLRTRFDH